MTAREAILQAFMRLRKNTGREAFSINEVWEESRKTNPEYGRGTIQPMLQSALRGGVHHANATNDVERVARGFYQLTQEGLGAARKLFRD